QHNRRNPSGLPVLLCRALRIFSCRRWLADGAARGDLTLPSLFPCALRHPRASFPARVVSMSKQRIGILTSGGDCPGLNAVIRGAVKASHQMGYDCVGFLKGYEGLYDPVQYVHLTPSSTRGILSQGGTILGSTNKGRFAATVG